MAGSGSSQPPSGGSPDKGSGSASGDDPAGDLGAVLAAATAGDEDAWRRLVGLFAGRVFALAKSRCKRADMAEEITQSVFATVAAKLRTGQYSERGRFESWIFRVTMNRLRDEVRRVKRQAVPTDPEQMSSRAAAGQNSGGETAPALERLREAMADLPPADREIIELRHHGGLSFKQLADLLDEPVGTLLARHHRALRKLQMVLGKWADGTAGDQAGRSRGQSGGDGGGSGGGEGGGGVVPEVA